MVVAFDRSPQVYLEFMQRRGLDANSLRRWYDLTEPFLINKGLQYLIMAKDIAAELAI